MKYGEADGTVDLEGFLGAFYKLTVKSTLLSLCLFSSLYIRAKTLGTRGSHSTNTLTQTESRSHEIVTIAHAQRDSRLVT